MKKTLMKINVKEWMGDMFIHKLEPIAELVLIRLMMVAEQAGGWLCAGPLPLSMDDLALATRVTKDELIKHLETLKALDFVAWDEERAAYYMPDRVAAENLSTTRSAVARKGGGNPALRQVKAAQEDLFKQKQSNVISFEKTKACVKGEGGRVKKEKRTKKEKNNNNIYIPKKSSDPAYFELGCIRLTKQDYQKWVGQFPYLDLDTELAARANWLETRSMDEQSRWFLSTGYHLRNRNSQAENRYAAVNGGAA